MSTPTDQFANLSLGTDPNLMAPTAEDRRRAILARDVLCSLESDLLPSQYQPTYFKAIIERRTATPRPPSAHWTVSSSLKGTALQWATYDEETFAVISRWRSPRERAMAFEQKIHRHLQQCFKDYDALPDSKGSDTVKDEFHEIVTDLKNLSTEVYQDRQMLSDYETREEQVFREIAILRIALWALESVCQRATTRIPIEEVRRSSRRTTSLGEANTSLFAAVIKNSGVMATASNVDFMLDALHACSGTALRYHFQALVHVNGLLNRNSAGDDYIDRFEALQQKANEEMEGQPGPSRSRGEDRRSTREPEPEDQPGSKRPLHQSPESTPKRGRRGGATR